MKKIALFTLAALAIPAVSFAGPYRQGGPYLAGFLGVTVPQNTDSTGFNINDRLEFDPGLNAGAALGVDVGTFRMEGEISYKQAEISSVDDKVQPTTYRSIDGGVDATALMGNIFVDLHNYSQITPYFGGGVGVAFVHLGDVYGTSPVTGRQALYASGDDTVFAYQAGAGLEIEVDRQLSLDIGYRYFGTTKASFVNDFTGDDSEFSFSSHNATVGLRLKF